MHTGNKISIPFIIYVKCLCGLTTAQCLQRMSWVYLWIINKKCYSWSIGQTIWTWLSYEL